MSPEDEAQAKLDRVLERAHMTQADLFAHLDALPAPADPEPKKPNQRMSADELATWEALSAATEDPEVVAWLEHAEVTGTTFRTAVEAEQTPAPSIAVRPAILARQQKISAEKEAKARELAEKQAAFDEIEAWRAANPDEYNLRRRLKRRSRRLAETGTLPRIYRRDKTAEEKRIEVNERKRKSRKSMTPEQRKTDRKGTKDGNA